MLVALALVQTAIALPLPGQWAQFSRSGSLNHTTETVEISTKRPSDSRPAFYNLRLIKHSPPDVIETWYTDSPTCPGVQEIIQGMKNVKMPSPAPREIDPGKDIILMLDGTDYTFIAPTSDIDGTVTLRSNSRSSIAIWIDALLNKLAPCWEKPAS